MKKSSFIALVLGTISGMIFGMGMCMVLLPEWNAFRPGIIMGIIGLLLALVTVGVWRKMEHKAVVRISAKGVLGIVWGIIGVLILGIGMSLTLLWKLFLPGIIAGCIGILFLLCLIPVCKGLK